MNQVLLETIVEKLEGLEISFLKENKAAIDEAMQKDLLKEIKIFQSEIAKLPAHLKVNNENINWLSKNINSLNFKFENGVNEHIYHKHHLHKGVWISIGLFLTSLLFLYGWINCHSEKKTFEVNNIKYRYLKVNGNTVLLKLLHQTDSLYELNDELFIKRVLNSEQSIFSKRKCRGLLAKRKQK